MLYRHPFFYLGWSSACFERQVLLHDFPEDEPTHRRGKNIVPGVCWRFWEGNWCSRYGFQQRKYVNITHHYLDFEAPYFQTKPYCYWRGNISMKNCGYAHIITSIILFRRQDKLPIYSASSSGHIWTNGTWSILYLRGILNMVWQLFKGHHSIKYSPSCNPSQRREIACCNAKSFAIITVYLM